MSSTLLQERFTDSYTEALSPKHVLTIWRPEFLPVGTSSARIVDIPPNPAGVPGMEVLVDPMYRETTRILRESSPEMVPFF